ncbi:hypothetical protein ACWEVP_02545 [Amycolatopsis sp. NPDC003865]
MRKAFVTSVVAAVTILGAVLGLSGIAGGGAPAQPAPAPLMINKKGPVCCDER